MSREAKETSFQPAAPQGAGVEVRGRPPGRAEILVVNFILMIGCIWAAHAGGGFWKLVSKFGDNADYAAISRAIRTWDLNSLTMAKHFWGLSYAAALVASVIRVSDLRAIVLVSACSSIVALLLAYQLWGAWVTLFFLVMDWNWIQSTTYGGALPLFAACVFAALLAARQEKWILAATFGALATTVQPLGVFVLLPILLMAWRRKGGWFPGWCVAPAALILALYTVPFVMRFHNPLASYRGYQRQDWLGGPPVTFPLWAIVENFRNGMNFANSAAKYVKVGYVLAHLLALGLLAFWSPVRKRALDRPLEFAFVALYSAFILMYNSPHWALVIHARLLAPLLPFFLWAFYDQLPKRRWAAYGVGAFSLVLACAGPLKIGSVRSLLSRLVSLA